MNQNDGDRMMQMITGYWVTQVVHATARFSIADHLAKAPATADDIANAEGINPSATFRLLRTCASLGMVKYDGNSRFSGTSLLDTLRKDHPQSLRAIAVSWPLPGHWLPWGRFAEAVKTGNSQTVPALGAGLFEYFAANAAEAAAFTESMTSLTSTVAKETAKRINTRGVNIVADIGGAGGAMLHALLQLHADLQGIVFDRPQVVASAHAETVKLGLQERVTALGGDFFESVPEADLYLLKHILHDWDDEACICILKNCRSALRPGGRIAVIELLIGEIGEPGIAPLFDVTMMVLASGRERSLVEFQRLFKAAGLAAAKVTTTNTPMVILEAGAA
jgi:O-methyltransferase/methyltransferase family protein